MKKRRYTMKIHIERVKKLLKKDTPCKGCPAGQDFKTGSVFRAVAWTNDPCNICAKFAGYRQYRGGEQSRGKQCPCLHLGKAKNIANARKKLREIKRGN